jgi:transposase
LTCQVRDFAITISYLGTDMELRFRNMPRRANVPKSPQRPKAPPFRRQMNGKPGYVHQKYMEMWRQGVHVEAIAVQLGLGRSTAFLWQKNLLMYGSIKEPGQKPLGRPHNMTIADEKALLEVLETHGWMYQDEMIWWLEYERGVIISQPTLSRTLRRNKWTQKAIETISKRRSEHLRELYLDAMAAYPAEDIIFIDESIFNEKTGWRLKAWAPIGDPSRYRQSINRGSTYSILPAMTIDGYLPCTGVKKGYYHREEFVIWIREYLLPSIEEKYGSRPMVIVMDNCSVHVASEIVSMIKDAGHMVEYLPPYSPDFNPIELTFHIIKAWMRRWYFHKRNDSQNFEEWLYKAINESGADQHAAKLYRHAAKGVYLPRSQWERMRERLRSFEIGEGDNIWHF